MCERERERETDKQRERQRNSRLILYFSHDIIKVKITLKQIDVDKKAAGSNPNNKLYSMKKFFKNYENFLVEFQDQVNFVGVYSCAKEYFLEF